jgi:hypothetical protein
MNAKKPDDKFSGDYTALNEFCTRLTDGQGNDKTWHQLRPCTTSSTGAVNMIRAANMIKHTAGSPVHEALEFLTTELGLKGAVVEDVATDSETLDFINMLRTHKSAVPCTFFDPVTTSAVGAVSSKVKLLFVARWVHVQEIPWSCPENVGCDV